MIITRTPYRISFFGGGTDYPHWYERRGGAVLSTTIDKYCYVTCRPLPPFFAHKHRIVWSRIEMVEKVDEIVHPTVRSSMTLLGIDEGVEIHHVGDLPARTGIGSSSTFTVGLLNALHALKGEAVAPDRLALEAIHVEQKLNGENVGSQDQVAAAYGGLNRIVFAKGADPIEVHPVALTPARLAELESHLMLFFTGLSRTASEIAGEQIRNAANRERELAAMQEMVGTGVKLLTEGEGGGGGDWADFGRLLHESWELKRTLSSAITTPEVDEIYGAGCAAGAIGGKLIGAGGGGFMLFFVRPRDREAVRKRLSRLLHVPFRFERTGSRVIFDSRTGIRGAGG